MHLFRFLLSQYSLSLHYVVLPLHTMEEYLQVEGIYIAIVDKEIIKCNIVK